MTLNLYGAAIFEAGFRTNKPRSVIRLRLAEDQGVWHEADFALAKTIDQIEHAIENKRRSIFAISETLLSHEVFKRAHYRLVGVSSDYNYFDDGDVIGFDHSSKKFRSIYRRNSSHNSFLVTEQCDNYCLMCSQPPKNADDRWKLEEIKASLPLINRNTHALTFTGGEPLLNWPLLVEVLKDCRHQLPTTAIQVLTNGRAFSRSEVVDAWKEVGHPRLMAAIPIYSSVDSIHDYVVQAKGAFDETILGVLKLKDRDQRVEIRIVLHALTAPKVAETCRWIARNLPFVDHVALMGLENTGFAIANDSMLWIDPMDYREGLAQAVDYLIAAGVDVSVYNLPRCVLDRSVHPYAVKSISDWKNGFVEECVRCSEKENCSGFFTTGRPRFSRGIKAIMSE